MNMADQTTEQLGILFGQNEAAMNETAIAAQHEYECRLRVTKLTLGKWAEKRLAKEFFAGYDSTF